MPKFESNVTCNNLRWILSLRSRKLPEVAKNISRQAQISCRICIIYPVLKRNQSVLLTDKVIFRGGDFSNRLRVPAMLKFLLRIYFTSTINDLLLVVANFILPLRRRTRLIWTQTCFLAHLFPSSSASCSQALKPARWTAFGAAPPSAEW